MVKNKEKKALKNWAVFSSVAIQMGLTIFLFAKGGKWLDANYNLGGKAFTVIGTLAGVAISMFLILRLTKKLNP
ncbi:AtpZ/AtpI family protein [uncultured Dokdonia sp.]|uniref:AtpZ/AtpI family protein n=1 Tax=uncultured Dokdonia sp. TaxID=575653 RepID=UPI002606CB3E|nr:AtpZ/AtpI family protein [uncultured Dokdonia sp.]